MDGAQNSWLTAAQAALAPAEQATLGAAAPGEGVVAHLIRIVRQSRRAEARRTALAALLPAARDRLPGVVELAAERLRDPSKLVRYQACRALAVALDRQTLPALKRALAERVEVPWNGLEGAVRAVRARKRDAFHTNDRTYWVLQDEEWDQRTQAARIVGSPAYGTVPRPPGRRWLGR